MANGVIPGLKLEWPVMAVAVTVTISMVTGAIQLGSVQTHVLINTARLADLEVRERLTTLETAKNLERVSRIDARQGLNEHRLDVLEAAAPGASQRDTLVTERKAKLEAKIDALIAVLNLKLSP